MILLNDGLGVTSLSLRHFLLGSYRYRIDADGYVGNDVHPWVRGVTVASKLRRLFCEKSQEMQPGGESYPPIQEAAHERSLSEEGLRQQEDGATKHMVPPQGRFFPAGAFHRHRLVFPT